MLIDNLVRLEQSSRLLINRNNKNKCRMKSNAYNNTKADKKKISHFQNPKAWTTHWLAKFQ